ncbi:MAG: PP2C family protein-serine/threonine phosphatase [Terracidiphilus sp.]
MGNMSTPWYLKPSTRWAHFRSVPLKRLWVLLVAVFLLFSVIGFYIDLVQTKGTLPYAAVVAIAVFSGLNAIMWIVVLARMRRIYLIGVIALQFFVSAIGTFIANWIVNTFQLKEVGRDEGTQFAATCIMALVIASYIFFVSYMRREGRESFRMRNELELAHGIQKTLVPPVSLRSGSFEVYGVSYPSEQVGGDLVDAVFLPGGDAVAYLADISGHGLQAGILMGMLKTAMRTALLDAGEREPSRTLPVLLDRINTVLPAVKEPQMYATFTGFRLGADGSVYYALAASPPFLQWHAGRQTMSGREEAQFPLGLLPVSSFDGYTLQTAPGDLLVVATDGILEVANKPGEEYGVERLKDVIAANARDALPVLAEKILGSARGFGAQFDDQTILLVRRL